MGIKPVVGPVTFDLGVIYYSYPGATDGNTVLTGKPYEWDYVEGKLGASVSSIKNLTTGATLFYSPEYTNKQGSVFTLEGAAAYELPKIGMFTPTDRRHARLAVGRASMPTSSLRSSRPISPANGEDSYMYWNVGLALAVDKLTLDFRYWDTERANNNAGGRHDRLLPPEGLPVRRAVRLHRQADVLRQALGTTTIGLPIPKGAPQWAPFR